MKESGSLTSPNYPDYYKPNKDCVWKITVQEGYSVALKFSAFEVSEIKTMRRTWCSLNFHSVTHAYLPVSQASLGLNHLKYGSG